MIRYSLKCANAHTFESWFQSAEAFDKLVARKLVTCTECGSTDVEKAIMAPRVSTSRGDATDETLTQPASEAERALSAMRKHVEENSEYVGMNFATEARAIHDGETPERVIYGEARPDDAKALLEDGIPVAPLPFMPRRKAN
ncbi:MAG: DUF1178 family protein [Pseudomonadota bacterium]